MSERCLFCDKKLKQPKQGRERLYCDANCRQKLHQRKKHSQPQPEDSAENRLKEANKRIRELEGENTKLKADLIFCQMQGEVSNTSSKDPVFHVVNENFEVQTVEKPVEVMFLIPRDKVDPEENKEEIRIPYKPEIVEKQNDIDQMKVEIILESLPQTLMELKELCPPELKGFDRSTWISKNRRKYGI